MTDKTVSACKEGEMNKQDSKEKEVLIKLPANIYHTGEITVRYKRPDGKWYESTFYPGMFEEEIYVAKAEAEEERDRFWRGRIAALQLKEEYVTYKKRRRTRASPANGFYSRLNRRREMIKIKMVAKKEFFANPIAPIEVCQHENKVELLIPEWVKTNLPFKKGFRRWGCLDCGQIRGLHNENGNEFTDVVWFTPDFEWREKEEAEECICKQEGVSLLTPKMFRTLLKELL